MFEDLNHEALFELIRAANFLDLGGLLEVTCQIVANMIKGKGTEEIREFFNIDCDFTDEELEKIKEENGWDDYEPGSSSEEEEEEDEEEDE